MENPSMVGGDGGDNNYNGNNNDNRRRRRTSGGKGRRKVEMKKIDQKNSRNVTFSKRRAGLFRKAKHFSEICKKRAAVIVLSPVGRPFAVGFPSVDTVVQTYLRQIRRDVREEPAEGPWWRRPIEGMDKEEMKRFKAALILFRGNLEAKLEDSKYREEQTRDLLSMIENNQNQGLDFSL